MARFNRVVVSSSLALLSCLGASGIALPVNAATLVVANCSDAGAGSLRATIANAASGDIVDLRGLWCPGIRTRSAIAIPQNSLTLKGPGRNRLLIDAGWRDSVLRHTGGGTLRIHGLHIVRGALEVQTALGGCIYSNGNVELEHANATNCGAHGIGPSPTRGIGGGIYAKGDVTVRYGTVGPGGARGGVSRGGGIYAGGKINLLRARIIGNYAAAGGGLYANKGLHSNQATIIENFAGNSGGAINVRGPVGIANTTISNNGAYSYAAGLYVEGDDDVLIVNSTISGNSAFDSSAALILTDATIANSTIAFNVNRPYPAGPCDSGAFTVSGGELHLESTIASGSKCMIDSQSEPLHDIELLFSTVAGSDNLVTSANTAMPPGTITADAMLTPLGGRGGYTPMHALRIGSPALDAGNNAAGLMYDQRGPGFPRVKNRRADIGAYER